jgi:hypothetical protein
MKATLYGLGAALKGFAAAMAAGLLVTACSAPPATTPAPEAAATPAPAAAPAPLTLNTSYNELMVAWIDNASHVLWDVEKKGFEPKNEADWVEIEDHAIQVAAGGTLIQLPGAGPSDAMWVAQDGWKANARLMSEAGKAALTAAKSRSLPALVEANGKLVETCEGCHKQFKPELPSEGIAHQRPHSESHKSN